VANNFFVKPAEPVDYNPQLDPIGNKVATRGQTLSFRVTSSGFPPETPPRFIYLEGDEPEGLFFDGKTGDLIWEPNDETELGEYELIFYLYVEGEKSEQDYERITVRVRDPNTSPRLELKPTYTVLAGTPFELQLQAEDNESPASDLTFALQGELPAGAEFNPSTGLLKWTTSENELPREVQLTASVTDRGDPAMSDQQPVTLSLIEDFTRDTFLTGIIKIDEVTQARLYNRAENVTSVLLEGKPFRAAGLTGKVIEISREYVVCEMDEEVWRLELGQALFERKKTEGPAKAETSVAPETPEEPLAAPRDHSAPLIAPRSAD
ncbi:MAG TPA: putative Ig domain-containing protein, partial [Planctomycetaceae bacterium]|nr:putative Ig domain-containing protein [Planctomycetaceae bacterium]